jgi:hypothetical protein
MKKIIGEGIKILVKDRRCIGKSKAFRLFESLFLNGIEVQQKTAYILYTNCYFHPPNETNPPHSPHRTNPDKLPNRSSSSTGHYL